MNTTQQNVRLAFVKADVNMGIAKGRAQIAWTPGGIYSGELSFNKRHGLGKMTWDNGTSFEGHWRDGLANGRGTLVHADGFT